MKINECINPELGSRLCAYELNQLHAGERDSFEEHLMSCEYCMHEAKAMQRISGAMIDGRDFLLNSLRKDGLTFDKIRRDMLKPQISIGRRLRAWLRSWYGGPALAGVAAVVILTLFLLRGPTAPNPYLDYLSPELPPYQTGLTLRGEVQDEAARMFDSAMRFYNEGEYAAAAEGIRQSLKLDENQPDRWLYLGVSQYAAHDFGGAIKSLKRAERGAGLTKLRSQWFLAQSYLYTGKTDRALPLLKWVATQEGEHAEDARVLIERIHEHEQRK